MTTPAECPCGSGRKYDLCCGQYHRGESVAGTPEALMRSRYSAYVLGQEDYLLASWHPGTRPEHLDLKQGPAWTALEIIGAGVAGDGGSVHFRAVYKKSGSWCYLEEKSRFVREGQLWLYLDGEVREGVYKPGRNDPCPCDSGEKFKKCCVRTS